jgi:TRAP-type C4-dicarboxylate transport system substrate-binding protein
MFGKSVRMVAVSAALVSSTVIGASATEFRVASSSALNYELYNPVYTTFMAELPKLTNGELTAQHLGLEVVNLRNAISSLESGIIDIGNFLPSLAAADFPNATLLAELAPLGERGTVMGAAVMEYLVTCGDCQAEFARKDFVYTASVSTPSYNLLTAKKPVSKPSDIAGLRLRSPGTSFSFWIQSMGAIPTEVPITEEYEALQSGLIDGTVAPPANLVGSRLLEVTKYYTPIAIGTYHTTSSFTVRKSSWDSLTLEHRRAVVDAAINAVVLNDPAMRKTGAEALEQFKAAGGQVVEPSPELLKATNDLRDGVIAAAVETGKTRYNIADAQEKVARFVALVDKWTKIIDPIENDAPAVADAVRAEIWSKVDLATYGN